MNARGFFAAVLRAVSVAALALALIIIMGGFFGVQAGEQDGDKVIRFTILLSTIGVLAGLGAYLLAPRRQKVSRQTIIASVGRPLCALGILMFLPVAIGCFVGVFTKSNYSDRSLTVSFLGISAAAFLVSYGFFRAFRKFSRDLNTSR